VVLIGQMVWRNHNVILNVSKYYFSDVHEAMFHDVERPFEGIFYILGIQKSDLDEIAKEMF
jgi:hypothetical protein